MSETKATADRLTIVAGELDSIVADKECSYMDACVLYCDKYKIEYEHLGEVIKNHQGAGFIEVTDESIFLTRCSLPIADSILCDFSIT